eukprot:2389760-Ditylum_brightwellii.AAC.1
MSMTHSSAGGLGGCITLTKVMVETDGISEYLDFGIYDKVWFKGNAGLSPQEPGRWLGVSHCTGRIMCYQILNQRGTVVSRSTVQWMTNLEQATEEVRETFVKFDAEIYQRLKADDRGYKESKLNPCDWSDVIEEDPDFAKEFRLVFNNQAIPEADEFTAKVLEDTYINVEIALPRDGDKPEFARVTKRLQDANGIPIKTAHDNPLLDNRIYEVEYLDGHKASLAANTIAKSMFAQQDAFIVSKNGGKQHWETVKGWEMLLQWKDGSSMWETMKDVKECYPVQLAEYAHCKHILQEPAFA